MSKWPNEMERYRRCYAVTCIKTHYAGQGIAFDDGDIREWTFTREEAEQIVERLNDNDWNPGCWAVVERDQYAPE